MNPSKRPDGSKDCDKNGHTRITHLQFQYKLSSFAEDSATAEITGQEMRGIVNVKTSAPSTESPFFNDPCSIHLAEFLQWHRSSRVKNGHFYISIFIHLLRQHEKEVLKVHIRGLWDSDPIKIVQGTILFNIYHIMTNTWRSKGLPDISFLYKRI